MIEKLKTVLPDYRILKIDDYRVQNCDGSIEKEEHLWETFPQEILKYKNVIVELSGGGKVSENIVNLFAMNSFIVLKLNAPADVCIARSKTKSFSKIPYPYYPGMGDVSDTIKTIDKNMSDGCIEKIWNKALNIISTNSNVDVDTLPLIQYEMIFKLREILSVLKSSVFLYGSAGRNEMTTLSDIDMYILTLEPFEKVFELLNKSFSGVRIMSNTFIIRIKSVLAELKCINDINDSELFYNRSLIKNPEKTLLKDDYSVLQKLEEFSKIKLDYKNEVKYTVERLIYYMESLPRIIAKGDEYKFYFHNNIVIHEYVKLKAFLQNNFDYSYLPLQAKKYLSETEWNDIVFGFHDNLTAHYNTVKNMVLKLIREIEKKYEISFNL
ncbi:MAG TPA: nucleotidyltransferase domain-containing protein [Spirochaetota bacterium]|nr:nucleotidyltransferase domain-containing protein [Spirochaetota bacterium]HPY86360.1 nucleotidyltransferase domain-containing protein [Spirochaetota bacterium]